MKIIQINLQIVYNNNNSNKQIYKQGNQSKKQQMIPNLKLNYVKNGLKKVRVHMVKNVDLLMEDMNQLRNL